MTNLSHLRSGEDVSSNNFDEGKALFDLKIDTLHT
jgi:hypothetical protein